MAEEIWQFESQEGPTPLTTAAIEVQFQGRNQWLQQDDILKLFTDKAAYILSYGSHRQDLGFELKLKKFEIGHHQGTSMASSYKSIVEVPDLGEQVISMNEPMKYRGLTFYQSSFQSGPDGVPIASLFSVNYDPGREMKYFGSLLIVIGSLLLFYNKRKSSQGLVRAPKKEVSI